MAATSAHDLFEFDLHPRAVVRRLGWAGIGIALLQARGLITLPLALVIIGADGYGFYSVVITAAGAAAPLVTLNVPDGAARLVIGAPTPDLAIARVRAIRLRCGLGVLMLTIAAAAAGIVTGSSVVTWTALVTAGLVALKVGAVHLEYFQRTDRLARLSLAVGYAAAALGLLVAVWLGVDGMLAGYAAMLFAGAAFAWRTLDTQARSTSPGPRFWPDALRLAVPLLPVMFAQWALLSLDTILIFDILGAAQAGAYSAAYSVGSVALLIPLIVNAVWFPTSQRLLERDAVTLRRYKTRITWAIIGSATLLVAATVLAQPLFGLAFSSPAYDDLPRCVPWIVAGFGCLGLAKVSEGIVYAIGRPGRIVVCYVVGAAANVGLNLWWIPEHGIVGSAWATAAGYGLTAAMMAGAARIVGQEGMGEAVE